MIHSLLTMQTEKPIIVKRGDHWATMGFYTRLNWNYQNVYFLEFSGRYDGSSRFASGNRWGFFPSFSAGYDIARTDYFKQWSLPVSQLKVRLSIRTFRQSEWSRTI